VPAINEAFIPEMFERVNKRLRAIEEQLALLSAKAGVPYAAPSAGVPQEVVDLARSGRTLDAIKKYRELTGVGHAEASEVVTGI
jgi:ribosomal protein L7/L12